MTDSIVLLTVDCLRADHVGIYGYGRDTTPNIDGLAESGVRYDPAYSNGPGTRFAFKSLLGGVFPLQIAGTGLPVSDGETLAERLSSTGYRTAGFANNGFLASYWHYDRGFDVFRNVNHWTENSEHSTGMLERINRLSAIISKQLPEGRVYRTLKGIYNRFIRTVESQGASFGITDSDVVDEAVEWIRDAQDTGDPYFAWIHFMGAHAPYQHHPEHREELGISPEVKHIRNPPDLIEMGEEPPQDVIDTYDANIRQVDEEIGRVLSVIDDETTVVVTGDHGEEFGLHNEFHTESLYDSMARVPLIVAGQMSDNLNGTEPACHIDISATLAGAAESGPASVWDGVDLATDHHRDRIYLGYENQGGVTGGVIDYPWKYICRISDGESIVSEELYDTSADPTEHEDRSESASDRREALREDWLSHYEEIKTNRLQSPNGLFDGNQDLKELVQTESQGTSQSEVEEIEDQLEYLGYK